MGRAGFDAALQDEIGLDAEGAFGDRAPQVQRLARQMQQAGLANDLGRQLVEAVQDDVQHNPGLTAAAFRDRRPGRLAAWDRASGDPQRTDDLVEGLAALGPARPVTVQQIPRVETKTPRATAAAEPTVAEADPAIAGRLQAWRSETAGRMGKHAFHVLPDATLERIAAARPQTLEELQAVKGIGPKKLHDFGASILEITQAQEESER
jgi:superfamily II DNA helicase RecQ